MPHDKRLVGVIILSLVVIVTIAYVLPESYHYLTRDQSRLVGFSGDNSVLNPPQQNPNLAGSFRYDQMVRGLPVGALASPAAAGMWEDGGFFVVDLLSTEGYISTFEPDGSLSRRFATLGADGLQEVVTAKLGPDGLIYLLDTSSSVYAYHRDGSLAHRITLPAGIRDQVFWVRSLAIDSRGTLYLLALDTIVVVDQQGRLVHRYTGNGQDWLGVQPSEFYLGPSDLCLAPDGMLYVADAMNYRIVAVNSDGNICQWIPVPELDGNLPRLGDLLIGAQGQVYVVDHQASAIRTYTDANGWSTAAKLPQGTDSGWEEYYHISPGQSGSILITDRLRPGVWQLLAGGTKAARWAGTGRTPLFTAPNGVAISKDGTMLAVITGFAGEYAEQRQLVMLKKTPTGFEPAWSRNLVNPKQVAFTDQGGIIVLDEATIKQYSPDGQLVGSFGEEGLGDGQFAVSESLGGRLGPQGFALQADRLWIADTFNHRVLVFDLDGNMEEMVTLPEELYPTAVALTGDNSCLWVLDAYAGKLHRCRTDGTLLATVGAQGSQDGQFGVLSDVDWFDGPRALLAAGERLFVADTYNHRVLVLDSMGSFVETLGEGGAGPAQFFFPSGLAVDGGGNLYVADSKNHRVQLFISK